MSEGQSDPTLKLDPWSASSLLQKAIRRGEAELAVQAAIAFQRYRGPAIWRRLMTIAVEDIGIADVPLVRDVARLGSDKPLRSVLGPDHELVADCCLRMAAATKDRSSDYLICAVAKLSGPVEERAELRSKPFEELIAIAADEMLTLTQRTLAVLIGCDDARKPGKKVNAVRLEQLLKHLSVRHLDLEEAVLRMAVVGVDPFFVTLPILWCRSWNTSAPITVLRDELPPAELIEGVPSYVYDKHTAAGKAAIARFALENEEVRSTLSRWVPEHQRTRAAQIAAFYADGAPVDRRLDWPTGNLLRHVGRTADMLAAGCPFNGVGPVMRSIRAQVRNLDDVRRSVVLRRVRD